MRETAFAAAAGRSESYLSGVREAELLPQQRSLFETEVCAVRYTANSSKCTTCTIKEDKSSEGNDASDEPVAERRGAGVRCRVSN